MNWFIEALKKYATFSGRATRTEYWYFILFYILIFIGLVTIDCATGTFSSETGMGILGNVYSLIMFIPSLAATVRRLHDTGRSGWWLLVTIIPFGVIALIYLLTKDSESGENMYSENPTDVST
jgi:uncharacterized membrane protein YhaH (DUF805 family)